MYKNIAAYGWMLRDGLILTIEVALLSFIIAILFGLVGAYGKLGKSRINRFIAQCYTVIIRGIPEYVLLLVLYYQGAQLIRAIVSLWSTPQGFIEINSFVAGSITLGFVYGAYSTEAFRGAILAIPKGQIEAAYACGMSRWLTARRIIAPQMWRLALPALGNIWLILLKSTAIISLIGLEELTRKSRIAGGATRDQPLFFGIAALLYLLLTVVSTFVIKYLERKNNYDLRKPKS